MSNDFNFPKKPLILPMPKIKPPLDPLHIEFETSDLEENKRLQKFMRDWQSHVEKQNPEAGFIHLNLEHEDGRIQPIKAWPLDYAVGDLDENTSSISIEATFIYEPERKPWYKKLIHTFKSLWRLLF